MFLWKMRATAAPRLALATASLWLGACSTPALPPFDANHPASPEAAEGPRRARSSLLQEDALTRRTRELFAQRAREAESATNEPPGHESNPAPSPDSHDAPQP